MKGPTSTLPGSMPEHVTTGRLEAGDFSLHDMVHERPTTPKRSTRRNNGSVDLKRKIDEIHLSPQENNPKRKQRGKRLSQESNQLFELDSNVFTKGLGIVTRAIYDADVKLAEPKTIAAAFKKHTGKDIDLSPLTLREQNQCLAALIRDACATSGWLAGWSCLVEAAPNVGLHPRVVDDVKLAANVYARLRKGYRRRPVLDDIRMEIGPDDINDSIYKVGPKSLGGNAWKISEEYKEVMSRSSWRDPGYKKAFSPCVAYGWIAVQIKVIPPEDSPDAMRLQLLNIIDYDLDYGEDNKRGFQNGFDMGAQHTLSTGTQLQGAAFTGMISYDFQSFVRQIQNGWVQEHARAYNLGPEDASPEEWAAIQVADCAALVPFAFESAERYNKSRTGMISGMIQLQCHDLLFDMGCSNRISTAQYAEAAGVGKYCMHVGFAIGFYEAIGQYFLDSLNADGEGVIPPYGYAACMIAGPWNPFNTRYRAWERCIKYTRQLKRSTSDVAKKILEMASQDLVLKDCDLKMDAGASWARAMKSTEKDLVVRKTEKYFLPSIAHELLVTPGVSPPDLCKKCDKKFKTIMKSKKKEEIHAIGGLPEIVTSCRAAGLAAGIRRAVLWASTEDCCDVCACRVGAWVDATAYGVLSALMHDEPFTGPSTWSLQNYFVGAVTFWPIELPYLLSGFDLVADMSFDDGAMGVRDIVDIGEKKGKDWTEEEAAAAEA